MADTGRLHWDSRSYPVIARSVSSSVAPEVDDALVEPVRRLSGSVPAGSSRRIVLLARPGAAGRTSAALRTALSPNHPARLQVVAPADRTDLIARVASAQVGLGRSLQGAVPAMTALVTWALTSSQVMERRGLIGMKRLIGASRVNVVRQVLIETGLLSTCGSIIGVAGALVVCRAVAAARGWPTVVPGPVLWQAPFAASVAAVVGATIPAWRAASIDPTVAISEG